MYKWSPEKIVIHTKHRLIASESYFQTLLHEQTHHTIQRVQELYNLPQMAKSLHEKLALAVEKYQMTTMKTMTEHQAYTQLVGRASLQTQMIFEPMRVPFVTAREIFGTSIRQAPKTLRAIEAGKPLVTRMRPMPSIDVSWEFITRPGRYAPTFTVAERTVIPLKMITRPTPETFKLLAHYEEVDRTIVAWAASAVKQPGMREWAKSFMRTFQTRASPAQMLKPIRVIEKQARITAFEFKPIIGAPVPSVFEGIAPSLAKIAGAGATVGLIIREATEEMEELERRFAMKPLERAITEPEYKAVPIMVPVQAVSAAVEERVKQTLKMEMKQIQMIGVAAEVIAPPAYPRPLVFPFGKEKEKRPPMLRKIPRARTRAFERFWPVGRIEKLFEVKARKAKDAFNARELERAFKLPKTGRRR